MLTLNNMNSFFTARNLFGPFCFPSLGLFLNHWGYLKKSFKSLKQLKYLKTHSYSKIAFYMECKSRRVLWLPMLNSELHHWIYLEICKFSLKLLNSKLPISLLNQPQGTAEQMLTFWYNRTFEHSVSSCSYLELCFYPKRLSGSQYQDWAPGAGWLVETMLQAFRQMSYLQHWEPC